MKKEEMTWKGARGGCLVSGRERGSRKQGKKEASDCGKKRFSYQGREQEGQGVLQNEK